MTYSKVLLTCPKCGHEWDEHLPVMDKLTDVFLAAEKVLDMRIETKPALANQAWQQLRKAIEAVKNPRTIR